VCTSTPGEYTRIPVFRGCKLSWDVRSQSEVSVHVASAIRGNINTPPIINTRHEPDQAIDIITHELFHRRYSQNNEQTDLRAIREHLYPGEERRTQNHITLHAAHEKLYLDVLQVPERPEREKTRCQQHPA
jgi:hypothetical protein